jgi:flavorubredoxin
MSQTRIDAIHDGIFRVNTPMTELPGGFSFNQYLVVDDEPLLFHTGPRALFPAIRDAIARVIPVEKLRWIGFSHFEADECGAMAEFLAAAPHARPFCSRVAAMVGNASFAPDREPRALADGESFSTGRRTMKWLDTPHLPHGWDCGFLLDATSRVLFCGDLFTQPGLGEQASTESDILGPSEAFRSRVDYYAHAPGSRPLLDKLVATEPHVLACMHGSAYRGDGAAMLRALGQALGV